MKILISFLFLVLFSLPLIGHEVQEISEIESALEVKFFPTSSGVEEKYRTNRSYLISLLREQKFEFGAISKDEYSRSKSFQKELDEMNRKFIIQMELFEEKGGRLYFVEPIEGSALSRFERIYAVCIEGSWYAFAEGNSFDEVLEKKNTGFPPIEKFYDTLEREHPIGAGN